MKNLIFKDDEVRLVPKIIGIIFTILVCLYVFIKLFNQGIFTALFVISIVTNLFLLLRINRLNEIIKELTLSQ